MMVRLSDEEHQRLSVVASGQGATLAGYLRAAAHQQLAAGAGPAQHHATQQPLTAQPARALAVLIDADNAQATRLGPVLAEAAKHGIVTLRRIYGDWTSPQMLQWKQAIQSHAVHPVQQFRSVSGKNSTDMALAIDAVDLLHTADLGGICHRVQRQRLHSSRAPHPRAGAARHGHRPARHPQGVRDRLRDIRLHGQPASP